MSVLLCEAMRPESRYGRTIVPDDPALVHRNRRAPGPARACARLAPTGPLLRPPLGGGGRPAGGRRFPWTLVAPLFPSHHGERRSVHRCGAGRSRATCPTPEPMRPSGRSVEVRFATGVEPRVCAGQEDSRRVSSVEGGDGVDTLWAISASTCSSTAPEQVTPVGEPLVERAASHARRGGDPFGADRRKPLDAVQPSVCLRRPLCRAGEGGKRLQRQRLRTGHARDGGAWPGHRSGRGDRSHREPEDARTSSRRVPRVGRPSDHWLPGCATSSANRPGCVESGWNRISTVDHEREKGL